MKNLTLYDANMKGILEALYTMGPVETEHVLRALTDATKLQVGLQLGQNSLFHVVLLLNIV